MKSKVFLLMVIAGFLLLVACTNNPIIEEFFRIDKAKPKPTLAAVTYTVAFESNGGSPVDSQPVAEGDTATRPENPARSGFGFVNWYNCEALTKPHYDFATPVTGDITLFAEWSQTFHTVIFDSNGGSDVDDQAVGENGTASRPVPTKDGYTFDGWYSDPDLTVAYDFDTPVTDGITLYAKWTLNTYTVTFMDGDTILAGFTRNLIPHGNTVSRPSTDPTKDGHTFDDWYSEPDLTAVYDFDTPVTGDIILYAKWTIKTYTVTFMDGDTPLSALTQNNVAHGSTVNRPATDPTKDGYTFDDWYSEPELTAVYDFDTPVTRSITLYAKWEIVTNHTHVSDHEMVWIPAGTFTMGSPEGEPGRFTDETQHQVTLTGFYMGKFEVTQEQYEAVMGNNPSYYHGGGARVPAAGETQKKRPVEWVSWYSVIVFCNKLSMLEGFSPAYRINGSTDPAVWGTVPKNNNNTWNSVQIVAGSPGYRLPTEAQWEYACRSGTTTAYNTGATISADTGWYDGNSGEITHEVGLKQPNAWGLYDMHGNVWEYCQDWYGTYESGEQTDPQGAASSGDNMRVLRGGSKTNAAPVLRSALRTNCTPYSTYSNQGFRIIRPGAPGLSQAVTYTVTFDSTGGSPVAGQTVTEGNTATRPNNPLYEDYTLFNWYTDSAFTMPFNFNTPIMKNTTLYAGWTDSDFPGAVIHKIFNVSNTTEWNSIVNTISSGGENKNYVVNVTSDFNVAGRTTNNFGSVSGIRVSLRGAGRTVALSSPGNLLRIGSGQTVILRELTLVGRYPNNNSVVYISGTNSAFIMQSGKISGNSISGNSTSDYGGGGVCVDSGIFTMNGGEISNNDITASRGSDGGGGVYVKDGTFTMDGGKISGNKAGVGGGVNVYDTNSTFTMNGGEISGNNALDGAGVYVDRDATFMMYNGKISGNTTTYEGGGVYVYYYSGTFIMYGGEITGNKAGDGGGVYVGYFNASNFGTLRIVTGTIYGSNEVDTSLRNTSSRGAALYKDRTCIAQYGTFIGETWVSGDNLSTTNNTIKVTNGSLQQ